MRGLTHNLSIRNYLTIGTYEQDREYRELLGSTAKRGLLFAGLLGIVCILIFVFSHTIVLNKSMVWFYTGTKADDKIMLVDKVVLIAISTILILLSRSTISLFWSRFTLSFVIWLATLIILIEDIASNDTSFSSAYLVVALIIAIGTVPFKGWHIMSLSLIVILTTIITIRFARFGLKLAAVEPEPHQIVYLYIVTFLLTGLSSHIYLNRHDQFLAHKKAKELSQKLKGRTKVLEEMRQKSENQAKELLKNEELKDKFFANISHDFRTPLTLIMGPLRDYFGKSNVSLQDVFQPDILKLMYRNSERLNRLINQILDLSKIEAGEIQLKLEDADLTDLINNTVKEFRPAAKAKSISLTSLFQGKDFIANIDPEQFDRILSNLLSNAIKFTPEGGNINIQLSKTNKSDTDYRISVTDNGYGIPEEELPYIFDRFYQASHTRNTVNTGTGIGLSLVRELIHLHDGSITVSSKEREGTEFTIHLPKKPGVSELNSNQNFLELNSTEWVLADDVSDDKLEVTKPIEAGNEAPLLLLVDDNVDILSYLKKFLSGQYRVIVKEQSKDALKVLENEAVDLIISDVIMPDPDGFELCKMVKENPDWNHIPVILLTARVAQESKMEGLTYGADDYLTKPFSASELMTRIENLIEIRRILRDKYSEEVRLKGDPIEVTSGEARFLKDVQTVIEKNMSNSNFGVDWLASEVNLSARQLQRKIKAATKLSAGGYIRMLRLEQSRHLLQQEWGNISEISDRVGFQNRKYFSRLFKQTFGYTPTEFIQNRK